MKRQLEIFLMSIGAVTLLFVALWLGNMAFCHADTIPASHSELRGFMLYGGYKQPPVATIKVSKGMDWNGFETAGTATLFFVSAVDGILEGWGFDARKSFERIGAAPDGFAGSRSWEDCEGWLCRNLGKADFYHVADKVRRYGYIAAGGLLTWGIFRWGQRRKRHYWIKIIGSLAVSAFCKRAGMWWVRNLGRR